MTAHPDRFEVGTCFEGTYDVLGELGVGGFGRVVKARQRSTGQEVAIKVLRLDEALSAEDAANNLQRLEREARLCATLSHPHIVRLIDSGKTAEGLAYVVFEFVPGKTLGEVLRLEGKLEVDEAVYLMSQVLDALSCAHAHGIVHRDLKPENIMLTRTGVRRNALVLDFGLSGFVAGRETAPNPRLTGSGELMGTPSYAAPEQLRGEPPSPESDLYSWGLVFLECLTGETAVSGRTGYEVLMKQLGPEPLAIPAWLREQRLGRLLRAVTAKDPAERRMGIPALVEALGAIQREATAATSQRASATASGERRQLTVVCCSAAVTSSHGERLELEDVDEVLEAHQALCIRLADEAGGTVARVRPGEVQVVFGHPRVRENDARRAVRMALGILAESKGRAARDLHVQLRLGVHSGLGIVRGTSGRAGREGYEIVGEPVQLATDLVAHATPDELLVTADTRALLREEMECARVVDLDVAGRARPLPVFRVVAERPRAMLDAAARPGETPFVGRAGELSQLTELWGRAESGEARVVLVQGEAGIGKSRLVRELRRRIPDEGWIGLRCVPEAQESPLNPVVEWLRSIPEPLDRLLARYRFDVVDSLPLLARLLGIPLADSHGRGPLSPERERELTLALVTALVVRMACARPLLLVLEDLHWADPTTLDFVGALAEAVRAAEHAAGEGGPRLLVVFTARPEFTPARSGEEVSVLSLGRLGRADVTKMLNAGQDPAYHPTSRIASLVAERTDGVPLFVEELVHALRDRDGTLRDPSGHDIPATLRELLDARLDALSPSARQTAQVAAALGREVRYDLLQAAVQADDWVTRQDVVELLDVRLLYRRSGSPDETYLFRHALVRDAAYESMVRSTRRRVHRHIAQAMRDRLPVLAEQQPELLALHLEEGGDLEGAVVQWRQAGDRSFRRAAYAEAARQLERALSVQRRLPPGTEQLQNERLRVEIETLIMLGTVLLSTRGHADPEVRDRFSRARALCEASGVEVSLKILVNLVAASIMEGSRAATETFLPRLERLAEESGDTVSRLSGLTPLALYAFWRGEHARAAELLARAHALYRTEDFRRYAEDYGWDGGIYANAYAVWNRWLTGDVAGAEETYTQLLAAAESSFDPQALPIALLFGMACAHGRRDVGIASARAERLMAIAAEQRLYFYLTIGQCGHAFAQAKLGQRDEGIAALRSSLATLQLMGTRTIYGYYLTYLAEALLDAGDVDGGLAVVAEGLALCAQDLGRVHEPELLRLEGELLDARGDGAAAEERLRRAHDQARAGGALVWQLRSALGLARRLARRGKVSSVRDLLAPVCERFRVGETFPDLEAARAALASACATDDRSR